TMTSPHTTTPLVHHPTLSRSLTVRPHLRHPDSTVPEGLDRSAARHHRSGAHRRLRPHSRPVRPGFLGGGRAPADPRVPPPRGPVDRLHRRPRHRIPGRTPRRTAAP